MGLVFWGLDLIYFDVIRLLDDLVTQPMCDLAEATAKQRCVGKRKTQVPTANHALPNNCSANHVKTESSASHFWDRLIILIFNCVALFTMFTPSSRPGPYPSTVDHHGGGPRDAFVICDGSTSFRGCLKT